jgi:c-di-GMP-binding flagellar brake protein YcgR
MEKRKFQRVPVAFFLRYHSSGTCDCDAVVGVEARRAAVINISEGGLGLLTEDPIPEETKLDLEFHLEDQGKPLSVISAVGQVCYNILSADRKKYHTGIEFIMIKEKDRERVASFVRARSHVKG